MLAASSMVWLALAAAQPGHAVLIKLGDGTGNTDTSPPADDPGIGHVGSIGYESGVYLGNGWVITANHVAFGAFTVGGQIYEKVPGSIHRLTTPGGGLADVAVFKIDGAPGLPSMNIASLSVGLNRSVIMHGHGRNRGNAVTWSNGLNSWDGWLWGTGHSFRWGTNKVAGINQTVLDTSIFLTSFDESGGADEAQALVGDSGGAVFYKRGSTWELTGIMIAVSKNAAEQPDDHVLFDNLTLIADLAVYRPEIVSIISQPTCDDGLDEDGDGLVDYPADPGCASASDDDERDSKLVCDDGIDQDGDGLTDWPADPGCSDSSDGSEQSAGLICDDGLDNDADGLTDHPEDPDCGGDPLGVSEGALASVPVTSGPGTGALLALLGWIGHVLAARRAAS